VTSENGPDMSFITPMRTTELEPRVEPNTCARPAADIVPANVAISSAVNTARVMSSSLHFYIEHAETGSPVEAATLERQIWPA
jgi:hypothetical protein